MDANVLLILLFILTGIVVAVLVFRFLRNFFKYDYLGNVYIYVIFAFILCFLYSWYAARHPLKGDIPKLLIALVSSIFDALKMIATAFDRTTISAYFDKGGIDAWFAGFYTFVSFFGLLATSISTILFVLKSFKAKLLNFLRSWNPKKEIYYIFSDPQVRPSMKLANELKNDKKIVIMYIQSSVLKTQAGTEYRDALKSAGFDVRSEPFSYKLCNRIFTKHFNLQYRKVFLFPWKYFTRHRKVTVYGLFSDDEFSTNLAINFTKAINDGKLNKKIYLDQKEYNKDQILCLLDILGKKDEDEEKQNKNIEILINTIKDNGIIYEGYGVKFNNIVSKLKENSFAFKVIKQKKRYKQTNKYFKKVYEKYKDYDGTNASYTPEEIQKDLNKLENFRVFVTYQDNDIDLNHNFSSRTLHIVTTLSQYDMISSEFVLDNPITNFVDIKSEKFIKKEDFAMNVTFLGLGKINRPIFEKLTYAYQLWGDADYLINYHILDMYSKNFVEMYTNEFVNLEKQPKAEDENPVLPKPVLYNIESGCNGKDLREYEILLSYLKDEKEKGNRFTKNGFEMFIISLCDTTTDVNTALKLRQALLKILDDEKLYRSIIFVRIPNETVINNLKVEHSKYVIDQNVLNEKTLKDLGIKAPIVIFGQNTTMSKYIKEHHTILNNLGLYSNLSYNSNVDEKIRLRKTQIQWIQTNKIGVLINVATAYSLKTKLEIFDYKYTGHFENNKDLAENIKKRVDLITNQIADCKKDFAKPNFNHEKSPLMKLAELEHNRWLATSYLYSKYSQWNTTDYLAKSNYTFDDTNKVWKFRTKNDTNTKHICMTNNDGLKNLYKKQIAIDFAKDDRNEENAIKLTFINDVQAIIDALKVFKQ